MGHIIWGDSSGDYARSDDDAGNDLSEVLESREKTVTKNEELGTSVGDGNGSDGHQHGRSIRQPSPNTSSDYDRADNEQESNLLERPGK